MRNRYNTFRIEIIDEILTLKCPHCKLAFIDCDACAALTCKCGEDAHKLVANCKDNPSKEVWMLKKISKDIILNNVENLLIKNLKENRKK